MKKYQLLIVASLLIVSFASEARLTGPDENPDPGESVDRQERERLRKLQEQAEAAAREAALREAFALRTKNARIDIEKKAIAHLMSATIKIEARALAESNDGELMTFTESILLNRAVNKVGQLNLNLSNYGDVDLNKVRSSYEKADAQISDSLYALYMKTVQSEQDKILSKY